MSFKPDKMLGWKVIDAITFIASALILTFLFYIYIWIYGHSYALSSIELYMLLSYSSTFMPIHLA